MCQAQNSVVSYVAMQARIILGNAAIGGSVYGCIVGNYHYTAAPCCEDASRICLLGSVKKMKIVISSSDVIVIYARAIPAWLPASSVVFAKSCFEVVIKRGIPRPRLRSLRCFARILL